MNSSLNDYFSSNRLLFRTRFPDLASLLGLDSDERTQSLLAAIPEEYRLEQTRSQSATLCVNGTYLYSRYNPLRDAERALEDTPLFDGTGCLFAGCGLAYLPELYCAKYPHSTVVIAEPDIFLFLLCLVSRPLDRLLSHRGLIAAIGTEPGEILSLLEKIGLPDMAVYESPAITAPNRHWYDDFATLRKRNREKKEINANTLKRFGDLWLKNMCKNLWELRDRDGIGDFAGIFSGLPVLVLAAGPSLDRILPFLVRLRKYCAIIAVDTAARACVRAGIQPDFIMLVDPQYWNFRHLDGIECPASILVTESAAWPPVFRFKCRSIHLCSSLFPLGKFLESRTAVKGELGAGGSVSTTAWDFARHLGADRIFMAGLDLGYPGRRTHFSGSIFEERTHTVSGRFFPAETQGYLALYGAGPYPVPDYLGGTVLTDKRLILYAWWFESRLASRSGHTTATITPEGVKIPGFAVSSVEEILTMQESRDFIDRKLETFSCSTTDSEGSVETYNPQKVNFALALGDLKAELTAICALAEEAIALCDSASEGENDSEYESIVKKLDQIDSRIMANTAKEIASMVFPPMKEAKQGETVLSGSKKLYREIFVAAKKNLVSLDRFS